MRDLAKAALGGAVALVDPQCRFDRCVVLLGHMRAGTTALSNVICSRPEVSGYGEAHVAYRSRADLGRLVVNHARRGAWSPGARVLFDKILHSRHDAAAPQDFFRARAVFVIRAPEPAIRSIRHLFAQAGKAEYRTDAEAAAYWEGRVADLLALWPRFAPGRRVALTHAALDRDPEAALARVSAALGFDPPLANRYRSPRASRTGGGGDPLASGGADRIERGLSALAGAPAAPLDLPAGALARLAALHDRFVAETGALA